MSKKPNGYIAYSGPSEIDGQPIVLIITGVQTSTSNPKSTGMLQTWIMRSDIHPQDALKTGEDASICGECPLRPNKEGKNRLCYVNPMPLGQIYKSYIKGDYPVLPSISKLLDRNFAIRVGSYGDPAAVPFSVWEPLIKCMKFSTGYTRRWNLPKVEPFRKYLMASCFNESEMQLAKSLGWRTFRVRSTQEPTVKSEVVCPSSIEAGHQKICLTCLLCNGTSNKAKTDVTIQIHGISAKKFDMVLASTDNLITV